MNGTVRLQFSKAQVSQQSEPHSFDYANSLMNEYFNLETTNTARSAFINSSSKLFSAQ